MQSRRQFLGTAGVALGLAGCTGSDSSGGPGEYADLTAGIPDRPTVVDGYNFQPLRETGFENFRTVDEVLGIDPTNLNDIVAVRFAPGSRSQEQYRILQGSFERETVTAEFDAAQQVGEYKDFERFETKSGTATKFNGVTDGTVVIATDRNRCRQAIDRHRGEIPSLVDEDGEFELLTSSLGALDWVTVSMDETAHDLPGEPLAAGRGAVVRPGKSDYRVVAVYPSESVASEQEATFRTEAARHQTTIWDHETAVSGRAVVLTAFVPTQALGGSRPAKSGVRQQILNRIEV